MTSTAGAGSGSIAWTYIAEPSEGSDQLSAQDIRAGLEKGTDDVKLQLLRHIITSTLNGTPYVRANAYMASHGRRAPA
jgi:coatomer subunit beta